jgi:DNA-binding transcriptional ArsR family regulator
MSLPHPDSEQITLAGVLAALGDSTRLAIVGRLAGRGETCATCGQFLDIAPKTSLSYHLAKLREAGIIRVEPRGTSRLVSLRRQDLESRFPGVLGSVLANAVMLAPLDGAREPPSLADAAGDGALASFSNG